MTATRPAAGTAGRFVEEDPPTLAGYLDAALEALEGDATGARRADALAVLRRVRWHLAAPARRPAGRAGMVADEAAFAAPRRGGTFMKARVACPEAIEALLRREPGLEALRVEAAETLSGGRSKLMAVATQAGCGALPRRFVFRQDWGSAVTGTSVRTEHAVAERAHRAGVRTPAPLRLGLPAGAGERPFMLMELAPGRTAGDLFDPPDDPALMLALADQLGRLHALGAAAFDGLPGIETRDHAPAQIGKRRARFAATVGSLGQGSPVIAAALARMEALMPDGRGPVALVHGDIGFHNLLVEDGRLTAVLDWEFAHLGHPAEDLGYIRADAERVAPWEAFMRAYRAAGGPAVEARDVDFYQLWGLVRLYCLLIQARAALRAGLVRDIGIARLCAEWIPRLIAVLDGGLARMEAGADPAAAA